MARALPEDTGLFAVSTIYGDRISTRHAIDRKIYVVQRRSYLAVPGVAVGTGELMGLHWSIFGEAFPDLAGKQRNEDIQVHGDPCSPPHMIGQHLAEYCEAMNARLGAIEDGRNETEELFVEQVELAAWSHWRLLQIHPFVDGNGRMARVLLNIMLKRFDLRPIEVKLEDGYIPALRLALRGGPESLENLIYRLIERENDRLEAWVERERLRARRRHRSR